MERMNVKIKRSSYDLIRSLSKKYGITITDVIDIMVKSFMSGDVDLYVVKKYMDQIKDKAMEVAFKRELSNFIRIE